jgi:hypothetical protein
VIFETKFVRYLDQLRQESMANMRTAFQFHQLGDEAKKVAEEQNKGTLLSQWLYNEDGTRFETSTTVQL